VTGDGSGRGYRFLFDQGLTRIDAERAHRLGFAAVRAAGPALRRRRPVDAAPVRAWGLSFPHPLGLAAGFDKNAEGIDALAALGFGHVEIGTVTALGQPGNPKPRLFRLPADRAILNRMGFNNDGAELVAQRLAARAAQGLPSGAPVLGVNIGKSKVVPDDDQEAVERDYARSTELLAPFADYLVVNVSSPNTPGLRNLQTVDKLGPLLDAVRRSAGRVRAGKHLPVLVKIAPDLADQDVVDVADLALTQGLDGIIATNTTLSRAGLRTPGVAELGAGGISGAPVRERSVAVLRLLKERVGDRLTLVSVGGIGNPADAQERLAAGATLIQAYSGFVYGGAGWPRRIVRGLR
jgi:dihydroorotate dehydrogenase